MQHHDAFRASTTSHSPEIDPGPSPAAVRSSPLASALDDLGSAEAAATRRFGLTGISPWAIIVMVNGGQLLGSHVDG